MGDVRSAESTAEGPWFEELRRGQVFGDAPGVTLTEGLAVSHQMIVGDRLRLPLDHALSHRVVGAAIAHPALVWDVAIGQSTLATQHVKANLFYRGLVLRSLPRIGDTLRTTTEVVALRQTSAREGRAATGLAALRVVTATDAGTPVLDFLRCAMIPLRDRSGVSGHADDLAELGSPRAPDPGLVSEWDVVPWRELVGDGPLPSAGDEVTVDGGDVVSNAPELARLTLNIASVHHDLRAGGGLRLVYGGHTIGIAFSQVCRAFPRLLTVLGWEGCDHIGPVHEGDTLVTRVEVRQVQPVGRGISMLALRALTDVVDLAGAARPVLDWRFTALTT